jgi:hypothetical protein
LYPAGQPVEGENAAGPQNACLLEFQLAANRASNVAHERARKSPGKRGRGGLESGFELPSPDHNCFNLTLYDPFWIFQGDMHFYDNWNFNPQTFRPEAAEMRVTIARNFMPGAPFDVVSPTVTNIKYS